MISPRERSSGTRTPDQKVWKKKYRKKQKDDRLTIKLDKMWNVELFSTAYYRSPPSSLPPFVAIIFVSRSSSLDRITDRRVGVAGVENTLFVATRATLDNFTLCYRARTEAWTFYTFTIAPLSL